MSNELEVLQCIFPEVVLANDEASLDIPVTFERPRTLQFESLTGFEISYLPPLVLHLRLPRDYPAHQAPEILLQCSWLPEDQLFRLEQGSAALWSNDEQVLYAIVDYLTSQAETAFGLLEHPQAIIKLSDKLHLEVLEYQRVATREAFEKKSYECEICLEWKSGKDCISLCTLEHVFCRMCLRDMFSLHIREGSVSALRCPSCSGSGNDATEKTGTGVGSIASDLNASRIPPMILQQIVTPAEVERYVKLCQKKDLEALPSSTYCPREFCATVLSRNPDEKLVICTSCDLAFCADCKKTWHGPLEPCKRLKYSSALGESYMALLKDPSKRKEQIALERFYGKKNLQLLVRDIEDQKLADDWRAENTQACPACGSYIEKSYGCNHMQCAICSTHFCFLCGDELSTRNPYSHFSDKGLSCYGKLFEGLTGLEDPYGALVD